MACEHAFVDAPESIAGTCAMCGGSGPALAMACDRCRAPAHERCVALVARAENMQARRVRAAVHAHDPTGHGDSHSAEFGVYGMASTGAGAGAGAGSGANAPRMPAHHDWTSSATSTSSHLSSTQFSVHGGVAATTPPGRAVTPPSAPDMVVGASASQPQPLDVQTPTGTLGQRVGRPSPLRRQALPPPVPGRRRGAASSGLAPSGRAPYRRVNTFTLGETATPSRALAVRAFVRSHTVGAQPLRVAALKGVGLRKRTHDWQEAPTDTVRPSDGMLARRRTQDDGSVSGHRAFQLPVTPPRAYQRSRSAQFVNRAGDGVGAAVHDDTVSPIGIRGQGRVARSSQVSLHAQALRHTLTPPEARSAPKSKFATQKEMQQITAGKFLTRRFLSRSASADNAPALRLKPPASAFTLSPMSNRPRQPSPLHQVSSSMDFDDDDAPSMEAKEPPAMPRVVLGRVSPTSASREAHNVKGRSRKWTEVEVSELDVKVVQRDLPCHHGDLRPHRRFALSTASCSACTTAVGRFDRRCFKCADCGVKLHLRCVPAEVAQSHAGVGCF